MVNQSRKPLILNLAGEFSEELELFFSQKELSVILEADPETELTHILIRETESYQALNEQYDLVAREIHLISLADVQDAQDFVQCNGKLIFNEAWLESSIGEMILCKYFQNYISTESQDAYPKFSELGSFNIVNPFSTGEYLDRMVYHAFESGMQALAIKTYFDHLLMYLAALKTKKEVGFPIEVTYGVFDDVFCLQMQYFAKDLDLADISSSLSPQIDRKGDGHLLNVAVLSSDFFDFTYMPSVNKVVVTGLWSKSDSLHSISNGLMLADTHHSIPLALFPESESSPFLIAEVQVREISGLAIVEDDSATISGGLLEEEFSQTIKGGQEEEDFSQTVKGQAEQADKFSQTVKGQAEQEDNFSQTIKGQAQEKDNFQQKISGGAPEEKVKNVIKGSAEKPQESVKIAGSKAAADNFAFKVSSDKTIDDKGEMRFRSLGAQPAGNNAGPAGFVIKGASEKEVELEARLDTMTQENDQLKSKMRTLINEVKIVKNNQAKIAEFRIKAAQNAESTDSTSKIDEFFKDQTTKPSDKEVRIAEEYKKIERDLKKQQIEALKKESFFSHELEKVQRASTAKDLIVTKTKETMMKSLEKKDFEIFNLQEKVDQVSKQLAETNTNNLTASVRDLEKQNLNLNKTLESYKNKVSSLVSTMESSKNDDGSFKDEARRLNMLNTQNKNQIDMLKKEVQRLSDKASADNSLIMGLKSDKAKLEAMMKKALSNNKEQGQASNNNETELKRYQIQAQQLESQLRDASTKVRDLEMKLQEALKVSKGPASGADEGNNKIKMSHLENSVKKLTQDLIESKNQLAEMKKETNKLRQDKTGLTNQLDKLKKEAEKNKPATPKKPGSAAA